MKKSIIQWLGPVLATFAILISVWTFVQSNRTAHEIASVDYQAEQQIKADISSLVAVLANLDIKRQIAISREELGKYNIEGEKEAIEVFLYSTTSNYLFVWIIESTDKDIDWHQFFYLLNNILTKEYAEDVGSIPRELLRSLESLQSRDYDDMIPKEIADNDHLINIIQFRLGQSKKFRLGKTEEFRLDKSDEIKYDQDMINLLLCLKENGVNDPELDTALGLLTIDLTLVDKLDYDYTGIVYEKKFAGKVLEKHFDKILQLSSKSKLWDGCNGLLTKVE